MTEPAYASPADVATRWSTSPDFVRREIRSGRLAAVRFGRIFRVPWEAVRGYEARFTIAHRAQTGAAGRAGEALA